MQLALSQRTLDESPSPAFCAGRQLREGEQALLWTLLHADPECPSRALLDQVARRQGPLAVRIRPRNRWRAKRPRNRRKGRPRRAPGHRPVASGAALVRVRPRLSCVGVPRLAQWLAQPDQCGPVVARLQQAIEAQKHAHPGDDFALVPHREPTLLPRLHARCCAPLLGIERLTACDTHAHPLQTLLGRGYPSATLRQFLGQLERINAAEALRPTRVPAQAGQSTSVDGQRRAYGSRVPRHKGTRTMRGRSRAGSHAVIAHDATGQALFVADDPPDLQVSQGMIAYGQNVVAAPGSVLLVMDRAGHAVAMARAFDDQGLGWLCLRDDHEPQGLDSFEAPQVAPLEDGTQVSRGPGQEPRPAEPRRFVRVEPTAGTPWVSGATPKAEAVLEATEWPRVSRARNERQAHRCKRMMAHGALTLTYGRTRLVGPDRPQQRARARLDQALEAAQQRVDTQAQALQAPQDQVAESEAHGHGKRLAQRQRAWAGLAKEGQDAQPTPDQRAEPAQALGPPRERAARDVRKQTIMTVRTLLLENALRAFLGGLLETLPTKVSWEMLLPLLFERGGARMEPNAQVVYGVNTAGLSVPYRRIRTEVGDGLWVMGFREQGQPIGVRLKDMPP